MRRIVTVVLVVVAFVGLAAIGRYTRAQALAPPSKMERVDALELRLADMQLGDLERQARPLMEKRKEILTRYHIDGEQLGKTVGVNFDTGEIMRKPMGSK
jgi:hypothetical protein